MASKMAAKICNKPKFVPNYSILSENDQHNSTINVNTISGHNDVFTNFKMASKMAAKHGKMLILSVNDQLYSNIKLCSIAMNTEICQ